MNSQAGPSILSKELDAVNIDFHKFCLILRNITNPSDLVCCAFSAGEDKAFTILIVHDFLEVFNESDGFKIY